MNIAAYREKLMAERAELATESDTTRDSRKPVELDQQSVGRLSRIDAMQAQAMAQAGERRRHNRIRQINAALARMDGDEYGYCVLCGDAIAAKRLAHDPATAVCIECAKE